MQRFELIEGTASKFWEVDTKDHQLTVRYGRIGTNGQTQTKEFSNNAAATKERDKLIKEKSGKGYSEVKLAASAALPAVAVKSTQADKVIPEEAAANASASVAATSSAVAKQTSSPISRPSQAAEVLPTSPTSLTWPSGGFRWKPEWEAVLPIVRGIHAPAIPKQLSLLSNLPELRDDQYGYIKGRLAEFAHAAGRTWHYWGQAEGKQKITREALLKNDHEFWLELCAQALANNEWQNNLAAWVVNVGISIHGVGFMTDVLMEMWTYAQANTSGMFHNQLPLLRHAIAASSEDEYQAAFVIAGKYLTRSAPSRKLCAYLFPHVEAWVESAYQDGNDDDLLLLLDCVVPVEQAVAFSKRVHSYHYYSRSVALLQARLHGEAAMALISELVVNAPDKSSVENALELLMAMHTPEMIRVLVKHMERKEVRAALDKIAEAFPAATLYTAMSHLSPSRSRSLEGWTIRLALRKPDALATATAALDTSLADSFAALLANLSRVDAPVEQLPELLKNPPWVSKVRPQELPTLVIEQIAVQAKLCWSPAEIEKWKAYEPNLWFVNKMKEAVNKGQSKESFLLGELSIKADAHERVLRGESLNADDIIQKSYNYHSLECLLELPEAMGLTVWSSYPPHHWYSYYTASVKTLLARLGEAAIPGFERYCQTYPLVGLSIAKGVDCVGVATVAMHALRNLKKGKDNAIAWIRAHPRTIVIAALHQAFGKDKAMRDNAQFTIRWMLRNDFESLVGTVANEYGDEMLGALAALKAADPLNVLPGKMPKLPSFFVPASFRRPEIKSGEALPVSAVEHIGMMLAISKLDAPYIGLEIVRDLCARETLAEFAWDMFEAWIAAGASSKEGWAFAALGLLGDDETARRLAPKIREWPGEAAHARAVAGLDILASIGTDVALMHLNAIANKVKFKGLQDRAREKIAAVAETRGFTTEELADRLVPDLGLDEQGASELDFGVRKFYVCFDESLKPFVKDDQGVRLKDLPKPIKSDDAVLADAAAERFKQMKKDAKAIASMQVTRLELGMVAQRRWSAEDFRTFFLKHPVMRFLAARVVWGVYEKDVLRDCFRVAEDWTLADKDDTTYRLNDDATVGIAHVLEIPSTLQAAFGQVFADYEILQPFKQLGRETYALTDAEKAASEIIRFAAKEVATGSVMGLVNRGWERGAAQDGGWVGEFHKRISDDCWVEATLDPGTVVGDMSYEPIQKITVIQARKPNTWDKNGIVALTDLNPIIASEILRDIDLLTPNKK